MNLGAYLRLRDEGQNAFGRRIGRSKAQVSKLIAGRTRPGWDTMLAIIQATGGAVMPNDFVKLAQKQRREQQARRKAA